MNFISQSIIYGSWRVYWKSILATEKNNHLLQFLWKMDYGQKLILLKYQAILISMKSRSISFYVKKSINFSLGKRLTKFVFDKKDSEYHFCSYIDFVFQISQKLTNSNFNWNLSASITHKSVRPKLVGALWKNFVNAGRCFLNGTIFSLTFFFYSGEDEILGKNDRQ